MLHRLGRWIIIATISFAITLHSPWVMAQLSPLEQERQGRELYQTHQYRQATEIWQQAIQDYATHQDRNSQARVLSSLALAYQQMGEWEPAEQAIATSLDLIQADKLTPEKLPVLAQIYNNQGLIQFAKGHPEIALKTWEEASKIYSQIPDKIGYLRSQINQAQALQFMGFYPRSCHLLTQALDFNFSICPTNITIEVQNKQKKLLQEKLDNLTETLDPVTVSGWRNLAKSLRSTGSTNFSQMILQQILPKAVSSEDQVNLFISLGKTAQIQGDFALALQWYQQAEKITKNPVTKVQSELSQVEILRQTQQWIALPTLISAIHSDLEQLPTTQDTIYAQINFVNNVSLLKQQQSHLTLPSWLELAKISADTVQQAKKIGSQRIEAYALGNLGAIYEQTGQLDTAQKLTEQALLISQSLNIPEATYRWQWQLGRIWSTKRDRQKAISSYSQAILTLESIKQDLVAVNQDIQFSFASEVEPVYRELVSLLLQPDVTGNIPQENLRQARDTIETLQLAELNNFLQEVCLEAQPKSIDEIDRQAAVIYPIILSDRLEIILSLPQQPLKRYVTAVGAIELQSVASQLRQTLVIRSRRDFYAPAQKIYRWLISPLETDLRDAKVKTLVFVLDGALRNIPITALYDGEQYLLEKYEVSLTPGLQLLSPQPLQQTNLFTLGVGLTQAREGFSPLYFVSDELKSIQKNVQSEILLNKEFTVQAFENELLNSSFPIVHIATHGQFSSNFEKTFLLAWDSRINIRQLDTILRGNSKRQEGAIELLILSACQTATGDKKAALGLAGMAVRSGARSTIATLWSVNDEATAELMNSFYQALATEKITKSAALRESQLKLLRDPKYRHPFYWSSYVLLGNWL
jgi:CHAT domain-containing protein/Flp pilus assembly protein TadD